MCLFACPNFIRVIRGFKTNFNGNINYIPYVILSKQVCNFEFTNYIMFIIVVVSEYSTIYELIIHFNSLVITFKTISDIVTLE